MTTAEANRDKARKELVELAHGMLSGSINSPIEACRRLVRLRVEAGAPTSSAFNAVIGVESETDDYPIGEHRSGYSEEMLKRLDSEVATYMNEVRPALLEASREIIREMETLLSSTERIQ